MIVAGALFAAIANLTAAGTTYLPIPGAARVPPATALMTALLGAGLFLVSPVRKIEGAARLFFLGAVAVAAARFGTILYSVSQQPIVGSFVAGLPRAQADGLTGASALVTGALIASGQLWRTGAPGLALFAAALAPILPLAEMLAYGFGLGRFPGEMSPLSVALLLPLSLVGLMSFIRRPSLKSLLSDTYFGRIARLEILAGLGFPLAVGAVLVNRHPGVAFDAAIQSALMGLFAMTVVVVKTRALAATEVQWHRSVRALEVAAVTDQLTGLINRHGVMMQIDVIEATGAVGVIVADLDNFKQINDAWGHAVGDRVLVDVAEVLRDRLSSGEIVARWGGEEFLVLLPGRDLDQTLAVAEDLRTGLARLPGPGGQCGEITASFGVSERRAAETSLDRAMHRADVALYNAKGLGRDTVVRDPCAGCNGVQPTGLRSELIPSDMGAIRCDCGLARLRQPGSVLTVSAPGLGSLN